MYSHYFEGEKTTIHWSVNGADISKALYRMEIRNKKITQSLLDIIEMLIYYNTRIIRIKIFQNKIKRVIRNELFQNFKRKIENRNWCNWNVNIH